MTTHKVLIVDDHPLIRRGLKQILADTADFVVAAEAANSQELFEKLKAHHFSAITLDISMPGRSGLEILKDLKKDFPKIPVLVLSIHPETQCAIRALRAGADGYLSKETAPEELIAALRKVTLGGRYISSKLAELLAGELSRGLDRPPHESLSDREYQVMLMIASGKAPKVIGKELGLSIKTVSTYRSRILEKLRLKTNSDLIHYVITENLISPS